ncbi:MAG: CoA-transferase [Rhodospirillales bacterium]|jgi:propionate CoA-transferase|nr:CoA-transferase [Rhodospirillales bacterium]
MSKIMTAEAVARQIPDGATIAFPGTASILVVDHLLAALEARFLNEGHPRDLTAFEPCNAAITPGTGIDRFAHEGMTRRVIASAYPPFKGARIMPMVLENRIAGYNLPMGVLYSLVREIGAGRPGVLTEVGRGTFVDPANGGGKLNQAAVEDLVETVTFDGRELLFYRAIPIDVTLLKATTADSHGNLTMESEPLSLGVLSLAAAAKASGGRVFAQVERIADRHSLDARLVAVPGELVDGVVLAPDAPQSEASRHDPTLTGEVAAEIDREPVPDGPGRVILARAAAFLRDGWFVNLGVGLPGDIPRLLRETECEERVSVSTEHGAIGGLPTRLPTFGAHMNPESIIDPNDTFNIYTGGALDAAFLGLAEADVEGNLNVSLFAGRLVGVGGFIDITHRTPRLFICGNFAAGGARVEVADGRVRIIEQGTKKKLVGAVEHLTFSGASALAKGQRLTMITERGLFAFTDGGWLLKEVAPGIEPERDIAPLMDFPLKVAADVRPYAPEVMGPAGPAFSAWLAESLGRTQDQLP